MLANRVGHNMKKIIENKIIYLIEIALIIIGLLCIAVVVQNNKEDALNRGKQILLRRESHHTVVRSKRQAPSKSMSKAVSTFVTHLPDE